MLLTALLCLALAEAKPAYAKPAMLVEPAELKADASGRFVILDVRSQKDYAAGHIPGAVWADLGAWDRLMTADAKADVWAARIGAVGIDGKKPVVVYSASKSRDAARAWWILRNQGVPDVRLVQGDWAGYKKTGGVVETDLNQSKAVEPALKQAADRVLTKDKILSGLKARTLDQMIDARSSGEYCGEAKSAKRNGAIPGAKHLDWTDTIDPKTGRFKPAPEMKKLFEDAGIALDKPTATYCQSGGRAAVIAFVYELMTGKPAKNYYRSWAEWGNDPDTPIVTPKAKKD